MGCLRYVAYMAILFPIIGFFVDLKSMGQYNQNQISIQFAIYLFSLPTWAKLLSIALAIIFLSIFKEKESLDKENHKHPIK